MDESLRIASFNVSDESVREGEPSDATPRIPGYMSFGLSVENCRSAEMVLLKRIISERLSVEKDNLEEMEDEGRALPSQQGVVMFLENIIKAMGDCE
jgi:hypothetical protein